MIVGNLNPIFSVATATGPMAPLWFATNTAAAFGGRIVQYYWINKDVRDMSVWEVGAVGLGAITLDSMVMFPVQLLYFEMPIGAIACGSRSSWSGGNCAYSGSLESGPH